MLLIQPQDNNIEEYELLRQTQGIEYELLELSFPTVMDSPEFPLRMRQYRERNVYSLHGAFIDLNVASNDTQLQSVSRHRTRQSCEMAQALGTKNVVFHTGFFPYFQDPVYLTAWAKRCGEFYSSLQEEYNLQIFIENCMDRGPLPLRMLMERAPNLRICLDVGHVNYGPTPLADWFSALGPYIGYLHFSDNNGLYDDHIPLGTGNCKWHEIDRLCRELGRELPITLEVGKPAAILQSLNYLKQNGYYPF